jgi:hypothetical protein
VATLSVVWQPKSGQRGLTTSMRTTAAHENLITPTALQGLSTVVHASGCVSLSLYVLLYEADAQAAEQLGQTPARLLLFTGPGLFVPKPTRECGLPGLFPNRRTPLGRLAGSYGCRITTGAQDTEPGPGSRPVLRPSLCCSIGASAVKEQHM